jgi:hypothetical protein
MRRGWFLITGVGLFAGALGCHTAGRCDCTCLPNTCVYGPMGTPAGAPVLAGTVTVAPAASAATPMPEGSSKPEVIPAKPRPETPAEPKPDK